ncbi:MAG: hypothetical protein J6I76_15365 [Oribacterium sp.]|nr:hypothetical protein [Oribacterium sp.]
MSQYDFIAADKKLDPLEIGVEADGHVIIIQNEDHVLGIYDDEPSGYTEPFTNLPAIVNVQIGDFDNVKTELFNYVKAAIKGNDTIELWSTWMGETDDIEKRTMHEGNMTVEDLRWVFGRNNLDHPRCLKIYKWTRGKK